MSSLLEQMRTPGPRRWILIASALVVVATVWGVGRWASQPMYVTLYRDLELADVAEIRSSLDAAGISHRLGETGGEVLVPLPEAASARVALARDGLAISGRPGLELFDKPSWGMTDFSQKVAYQRALEGELSRTISAVQGVERAQVHLALGQSRSFRREGNEASASVVLTLTPGRSLAPETVDGISYILANSVENLDAGQVAVMTADGTFLSVPASPGSNTAATGHQMELQRSVEARLGQKIQDLLTPLLGAGKVRAEVAAQLDYDRVNRTVETYAPGADTVSGSGVDSHALERKEAAVGKLLRITAAVVVDQDALRSLGSANGAATPDSGLTARLETMIGDAIGIDPTRGDRLSLVTARFDSTRAVVPPVGPGVPGGTWLPLVERLLRPLIGLVAIVVLAVFGLRVAKASWVNAQVQSQQPAVAPGAAPGAAESVNQNGGGAGEPNLQVVRGWLRQS